ncbi:MAG: hypothetical protein ABEI86_04370 [Halobacteriaceae archaeon]
MSDNTSESLLKSSGLGGITIASGIVCCMGLKLLGGAVLFSGIAAMIGLSTDQTVFLVGGISGLLFAVLAFAYHESWNVMPT